jgi:hypothetical protein
MAKKAPAKKVAKKAIAKKAVKKVVKKAAKKMGNGGGLGSIGKPRTTKTIKYIRKPPKK